MGQLNSKHLSSYLFAMDGAAECAERLESGHRALGATVGAVWWETVPLTKPYPLSRSDIPLPQAPAAAAEP